MTGLSGNEIFRLQREDLIWPDLARFAGLNARD
jgi:hypothetical protein